MAHIERIEGKRGLTYRFIVSGGFDITGKRITHKKTWKPPDGMRQHARQKKPPNGRRRTSSAVLNRDTPWITGKPSRNMYWI